MALQIYIRPEPNRAVAVVSSLSSYALVLHRGRGVPKQTQNTSSTSRPQCLVQFVPSASVNLSNYTLLRQSRIFGTLGLINISGDVFLCAVTSASEVANIRPSERVLRIAAVEFCTCYILPRSNRTLVR